jgi:hypothetical protein
VKYDNRNPWLITLDTLEEDSSRQSSLTSH